MEARMAIECRSLVFVTLFINDEKVMKKARCAFCKKAFKPPARGRPPRYCSASHRQQAYQVRRIRAAAETMTPSLLLGRYIDAMRTKAGIERTVVDCCGGSAFFPPEPNGAPARRQLYGPGHFHDRQ
jgi:hypothetical protein